MRHALVVGLLAACGSPHPAPAPHPAPVSAPAPAPARAPAGANAHDHAHLAARLEPLLAPMQDCLPRADLLGSDEPLPVTIQLDTADGHLVACARAMTSRGDSAFLDPVLYGCWNVDPATGAVARRADLVRAYFQCADGSCLPYADVHVISYDGAHDLSIDSSGTHLAVGQRDGDLTGMFPSPVELPDVVRGVLTYVGHSVFVGGGDATYVLDDAHGAQLAKLPPGELHVVDDGHVVLFVMTGDDADTELLYDLATHATHPLHPPGTYAGFAVSAGGASYAIDDDRRLAELDPTTFALRGKKPLRVCP